VLLAADELDELALLAVVALDEAASVIEPPVPLPPPVAPELLDVLPLVVPALLSSTVCAQATAAGTERTRRMDASERRMG
jgi:hypothetical protein